MGGGGAYLGGAALHEIFSPSVSMRKIPELTLFAWEPRSETMPTLHDGIPEVEPGSHIHVISAALPQVKGRGSFAGWFGYARDDVMGADRACGNLGRLPRSEPWE